MVYYGLLLFFIFEYVRPTNFFPALTPLRLNTVIPIGIFLGAVLTNERITNRDVWREPNTRMILFLLGLIVLSILTADVTLYAFNVFKTVIGYVLIYWVISKQVTDIQRIKGVFKTLVFVHVLLVVLTPELITNPEVRHYLASGTFLGDGNDFALSVNLVVPLCIFLLLDAPNVRHRLMYAAALVLLVLCIIGTSSRGGTLALAVMGLYYWVKSDRKFGMAIGAAALVGLVFIYAPPTYFQRMELIKSYETEGSAQGRIMAWKAGVRMALDHPILGVGAGHFPVKFGVEYRPPQFGRTEIPWLTAHSIYFLVLGELGFPGLAVLLVLIGSNLVANRRVQLEIEEWEGSARITDVRLLVCLSASLIAFAVAGAFLTAIYYPHIYVLSGLLAAARRIVRDRLRTSESVGREPQSALPKYDLALR